VIVIISLMDSRPFPFCGQSVVEVLQSERMAVEAFDSTGLAKAITSGYSTPQAQASHPTHTDMASKCFCFHQVGWSSSIPRLCTRITSVNTTTSQVRNLQTAHHLPQPSSTKCLPPWCAPGFGAAAVLGGVVGAAGDSPEAAGAGVAAHPPAGAQGPQSPPGLAAHGRRGGA
jgi:hypothetical protein